MKIPLLSENFTPDAPLRAALKQYHDTEAEAARLDGIKQEAIARRQRIIEAADMENPEALRQAGDCDIKSGMATHKALQLRATLPALAAQVDARHYQLARTINRASTETEAAFTAHVRNLLAPMFSGADSLTLDQVAADVVHHSPVAAALGFSDERLSVGNRKGTEIEAAKRLLGRYGEFTVALNKAAAFLPKGFAPFPASADEMDEKFPLAKTPAPVAVVGEAEQERRRELTPTQIRQEQDARDRQITEAELAHAEREHAGKE